MISKFFTPVIRSLCRVTFYSLATAWISVATVSGSVILPTQYFFGTPAFLDDPSFQKLDPELGTLIAIPVTLPSQANARLMDNVSRVAEVGEVNPGARFGISSTIPLIDQSFHFGGSKGLGFKPPMLQATAEVKDFKGDSARNHSAHKVEFVGGRESLAASSSSVTFSGSIQSALDNNLPIPISVYAFAMLAGCIGILGVSYGSAWLFCKARSSLDKIRGEHHELVVPPDQDFVDNIRGQKYPFFSSDTNFAEISKVTLPTKRANRFVPVNVVRRHAVNG